MSQHENMIQNANMNQDRNLQDKTTLEAIGRIYCGAHHKDSVRDEAGLCTECRQSIDATLERSTNCPYGHKHNCEDCETKCQSGEARDRIRAIMAYAAPRMVLRHPIMTLRYGLRKVRAK